jgi:hypothetical protein
MLIVWKNRLLIDWTDEIEKLNETMMIKAMMKMMMMKIASMNVHNSLMRRWSIEIFKLKFDLLRFVNNEIRNMMI